MKPPIPNQTDQGLRFGTNLIVAGAILGCVFFLMLPREIALELTRENGWVEILSVLAVAGAVLVAVVKLSHTRSMLWLAIAIVPFYMVLRELDLQKAFTARSIASTGFYFHPDIPLLTKLTVLTALSPLAFAGFYLMLAGLRELRRAGGPKADWWRPLFFAGALLVGARVTEKALLPTSQIIEEVFELAFVSLILLVIATQALRRDGAPPIELEQPPG